MIEMMRYPALLSRGLPYSPGIEPFLRYAIQYVNASIYNSVSAIISLRIPLELIEWLHVRFKSNTKIRREKVVVIKNSLDVVCT